MVRGGIRFGRLVARAGVGAGGEWRTIVARGAAGLEPVSQRTVTGMIGAELEAFASVWRGLRAGGMLSTRFYLGGTSYTWLGRKVYRAPQATFGLGARIGFAF